MFVVHDDRTIYATRGDAVYFPIEKKMGDAKYMFQPEDIVRFKIFAKKNPAKVVLCKDFAVESESTSVNIFLEKNEMKFGEIISKPTDYWYEVELNPDTYPDTFIGYNDEGPAIFKLFPEAKDITEGEIEDPVENGAVSRMLVTFVHEYLDSHSELIIKEILKQENLDTIIQEILKEHNIESVIQEIIKEGRIETIVQEILSGENFETIIREIIKKENLETIVQEIIKEDNIGTIIQEIVKEENISTIVDRVMEEIIDRYVEAGVNGATFTPHVDAEGNLSWTNNGGLENPAIVNIRGGDGTNGKDGYTPVRGKDYFTDADKVEIVNDVLAALPYADEVSY